MDLRVTGADDLAALGKALKAAGDRELRRELMKGLQRAGKPAKEAAKAAARSELPSSGGLGEYVARSKFSVRTRASGNSPGVEVVAKNAELDLPAMNRGRLRHPVYGNRNRWVTQQIKPRWFTDAMEAQAPQVRRELVAAIRAVAAKL